MPRDMTETPDRVPDDRSSPAFDFPMDPEALADAIDIPLTSWPGNCHGIATAILSLVPVPGLRLARGHYDGPIAGSGAPLAQHTWLKLADGRVLDPTRWVFDAPNAPYIYLGACDAYDEGGRANAAAMPPPFPGTAPDLSPAFDAVSPADRERISDLVGHTPGSTYFSDCLRRHLAQDPDTLDDPAAIYEICERAGQRAWIPIDSWIRVMAPETITSNPSANRTFALPPRETLSERQMIAKCLIKFCLIETRVSLESDLEEFDVTLEQYHDALTRFETWPEDFPLEHIGLETQFIIGVVMTDILGQGFGNALRVERYAESLGYDIAAFRRAFGNITSALGLSVDW